LNAKVDQLKLLKEQFVAFVGFVKKNLGQQGPIVNSKVLDKPSDEKTSFGEVKELFTSEQVGKLSRAKVTMEQI